MISGVSTRAIDLTLQRSMRLLQSQMIKAQKETQTGVMSELDLGLAEQVQRPLSLWRDVDRLDAILHTNKSVATVLNGTQTALESVRESARALSSSMVAAAGGGTALAAAEQSSRSALASMVSVLNTQIAGQYPFSGINSDVPPFEQTGGIPGGAEMDAVFLAHFGFAKDTLAASSVSATDFDGFLQTQIAPVFFGNAWKATISSAADIGIRAKISLTETVTVSISANDGAIRSAVFAAAASANFLGSNVSTAAKNALIKKSFELTANAQAGIAALSTGILLSTLLAVVSESLLLALFI